MLVGVVASQDLRVTSVDMIIFQIWWRGVFHKLIGLQMWSRNLWIFVIRRSRFFWRQLNVHARLWGSGIYLSGPRLKRSLCHPCAQQFDTRCSWAGECLWCIPKRLRNTWRKKSWGPMLGQILWENWWRSVFDLMSRLLKHKYLDLIKL